LFWKNEKSYYLCTPFERRLVLKEAVDGNGVRVEKNVLKKHLEVWIKVSYLCTPLASEGLMKG
jgi:hypothetical protein